MSLVSRTSLATWLLLFSISFGWSQYDAPTGYYDAANGMTGTALKNSLHGIVATHTVLPYTSTATDVWKSLKVLDEDPTQTDSVILIYSGLDALKANQYSGSNGTANTWDREHLWPQSYGLVVYGDNAPPKTDIFNLRPINPSINSTRNNRYYDVSTAPVSTKPAAPGSDYDGDSWQPRADDRGQIARSIFYMATVYDGTYANAPALSISDTPSASNYTFGKLSTLLLWNRQYPVTTAERRRNQIIYDAYQRNRNPFIDNRYYADMVFLNETAEQAWAGVVFSIAEQSDSTISGDLADPDGDGVPNLLEYAFNLGPKSYNAPAQVQSFALTGSNLTLTHRKNRRASDLVFHYETSTDLVTWQEVGSPSLSIQHLDGETDSVTFTTPVSGPQQFARVRIRKAIPAATADTRVEKIKRIGLRAFQLLNTIFGK